MGKKDFFTFCTTLKPVELRTLGQLTETVHLKEGDTLYHKDDEADALFIISRGVVEMVWPGSDGEPSSHDQHCYLSRGDMIGAVALLTNTPHTSEIRACEAASLQKISRDNLPRLRDQLPSFMCYIAEQLSWQLSQINELHAVQSNCLELSGNLENFDMVTVFQTIFQSSQTGELLVCDDNDTPTGIFLFQDGVPVAAQYAHLLAEEAIWQIFLRDLKGTFSFARSHELPDMEGGTLQGGRSPDNYLLNALQMRDEFQDLLHRIPSTTAILTPLNKELDLHELDGPDADVIRYIWNNLHSANHTLESLLDALPYNELTLYRYIVILKEADLLRISVPSMKSRTNVVERSPIHLRPIRNTTRIVRQSPIPV